MVFDTGFLNMSRVFRVDFCGILGQNFNIHIEVEFGLDVTLAYHLFLSFNI